MVLPGEADLAGGEIATATPIFGKGEFIGRAFGGGAYFEAVLKFNPQTAVQEKGYPGFWALPIEAMVRPANAQWEGQAQGYQHFVEADALVYGSDVPDYNADHNHYVAGLRDWFGVWEKTCPSGVCNITPSYRVVRRDVPADTDFSAFHRYGLLWVPASKGHQGEARFYFDGKEIGQRLKWEKFTNQTPSVVGLWQLWTYGIMDRQHYVLILGSGANVPITVQSVDVWQKDESENLAHR